MNKFKIIVSILTTIFIITILIYFNSYNIAIFKSGNYIYNVIEHGFDNGDHEFKVVEMENNKNIAIGYLKKNNLGFWKMEYMVKTAIKSNHSISTSWAKTVGLNSYAQDRTIWQWNSVFYGHNATKPINIDSTKIPQGVIYYIKQSKDVYTIHFVTYLDPELLNGIDVDSLIKDSVKTN